MALGTTGSRVLGLVREMLFAALFPRAVTDAWIAAFRLPNLFRRLLGEGSLSVSFVPVFVENLVKDEKEARGLLDGFFTLLLVVLTVLTVLGVMFPEPVLRVLLAPDYVNDVAKFALTVRMAQIMFGFVFLICLYAFFMAVLNAIGVFSLPAVAPMLFNVAIVISTLLPDRWFPSPGDGLAGGVIVGGFLQMIILVPALAKRGYLPKLRFVWTGNVRKVLLNMVPGLFGMGLLQLTLVVNMRFASQLGEGPISWINWADRLLELPLSLISVSLGTALLPTLSDLWSRGLKDKMTETLSYGLRLNLYLCLAAAVGLFTLAQPIVEVLFRRGQFTDVDAAATVGVLRVWALIMIPTATLRVLAPAYFSVKNTWMPAAVSAFCLVIHIFVAPRLMEAYGLTGLNCSSLLSASLNVILLLVFFPWLVTKFDFGGIALAILRFGPALVALGLGTQVYGFVYAAGPHVWVWKVVSLGIAMGLGVALFATVSHLMKLPEWDGAAAKVVHRLGRKIKRK